ncbi:MAG: TldD/PmbA family protein [Planctomycetota bacterium]|jgi:predicted Zn-dependent protease
MIGRDEFKRLADIALDASQGDHTVVSLAERRGGTARFANNQIVQHVNTYRHELKVNVAIDGRSGSSATTELSPRAIAAAVARAQEIARVSPPDPEHLPPLPAQEYPERETFSPETAAAGPPRLIKDAREAIRICQAAELEGAGIVSAYAAASGVAASTGLFAHEHHTRAEFSLTATGADSSGWVKNANRNIDRLGVVDRAHKAVDKAKRSAKPKEIPAGRYTVILEPAAVAGLLGPVSWAADAKAYYRGTSALSGKLGQQVIDPRLTLRNDPRHPELLGRGFSSAGLPSDEATWIEKGVLRRIDHDRFTAREKGVEPSYALDAPHLVAEDPTDDLLAGTERGIYVTNFWYIRFVNPTDLTLTGMTRDGTFLVEDGAITAGLINFRWHESPLRAFNQVEACGKPTDAITMERTKMWLPPMKIRDFNFSSVTRF